MIYLLDTNVISEARKKARANPGVQAFFSNLVATGERAYLSSVTVGELVRGVERIRHRGDLTQAAQLEQWLKTVLSEYESSILPFGIEEGVVWGRLRVPHHENALDKQLAATAIVYDLTVVTRNTQDFCRTGARLLNPFT